MKELVTVPGYILNQKVFTVDLNAPEVELSPIENYQTVIHISKVDAETGEELPGATLELYAPDGTLIESWETTDTPHVITGLPVGEGYILKETTAPEGYQLAEDIAFTVEETTEIQIITMEDEHTPKEPDIPDEPTEPDEPTPEIPQTGGSRAVIWVGAAFILSLLGIGILIVCKKKRH